MVRAQDEKQINHIMFGIGLAEYRSLTPGHIGRFGRQLIRTPNEEYADTAETFDALVILVTLVSLAAAI